MKKLTILSIYCIIFNSCIVNNDCDPILEYNSDVVFYMDANAAFYLYDQDVNYLRLILEGIEIGEMNYPFTIQITPPNCYDFGFISSTINWYQNPTKTVHWHVVDEYGTIRWEGNNILNPNDCSAFQLTYNNLNKIELN